MARLSNGDYMYGRGALEDPNTYSGRRQRLKSHPVKTHDLVQRNLLHRSVINFDALAR
jgi:hypothetical protein